MGSRERQHRTREHVRRAILDAARELFVSEGFANVSLRKIAERIEYSPAAIYGYFSGKDEIFFALAEEGFRLLIGERPPRPARAEDPVESIRRIFWHYYRFSKTHPEYFALMFVDRSVPRICADWTRFDFVRQVQGELSQRIQDAVGAGLFPAGTRPEAVFRIVGAAMLGAAVRHLSGRTASHAEADALARDVLEAALTGLRHGSPVTLAPPATPSPPGRRTDRPRRSRGPIKSIPRGTRPRSAGRSRRKIP